jgi:hypothetical protein
MIDNNHSEGLKGRVKSSPNMKASRQKKNAGGSTAGRGW